MSRQLEAMSCEEALERLEAFVDGELAGAKAAGLEAHLASCAGCAAEHRLALDVRRELRALPELETPPAVLAEVFRKVEASASPRRRLLDLGRLRRPRWLDLRPAPAWTALAAALLAAVVIGTGLWLAPPAEEPAPELDPAAVARATEEARYALAYVGLVSQRAGLKLRDDVLIEHLVRPSAEGLSRAFFLPLGPVPVTEPEPEAAETDRS